MPASLPFKLLLPLLLAWAGAAFAADGVATPPAKAIATPDPLEVVRERLAQRLGVIKPGGRDDPNLVRVVSKAGAADGAASAAVAAAHGETPAKPAQSKTAGARRAAPKAHNKAAADAPHAEQHPAHWDYQGSGGPEQWAHLSPEFATCARGSRQSPIDIRDGIKVELDAVQFDYKPSAFKVLDNGHTVQVNVAPGNAIEVMGQRYELVQFHFHRPSEERINGKPFDMVAHLVHKSEQGRLAVVAVLLEKGSAQPVVQSVWNNLPLEKGDEVAARAPIDLNQLLPRERGYYTYMGSLTTPPCSEGVLWMVMKQPVTISDEQIGIFARLYPMNARPVQAASGRLIKESN
jgi:carbonic anhydrase